MACQRDQWYLDVMRRETRPALGCTEPAAAALCCAAAALQLDGNPVEKLTVTVSEYIFKNAMNVGIPRIGESGLPIACAMGAISARPEQALMVLDSISEEEAELARAFAKSGAISISIGGKAKIYVHALAEGKGHTGEAEICGDHTNITLLRRDGKLVLDAPWEETHAAPQQENEDSTALTVRDIYQFAREVPVEKLFFLRELVEMNEAIALEGLTQNYGLRVGKTMSEQAIEGMMSADIANYAIALTTAGADARMAGCDVPVMSVAGSGNQGLTATMPVIAVAHKRNSSEEEMLRALALSILVTVHTKRFIGRLSVLCGCSISAAIGAVGGVVLLFGGSSEQVALGVKTLTADIAGVVCDGAKPGCALKIATAVSAAMRSAMLALADIGATDRDGIVDQDVEQTLANLGTLGNEGMRGANQAVLAMMLGKAQGHCPS